MKKIALACLIAASCFGFAHSAIICTSLNQLQIDSNGNYQLDVDGDGTKDFWFYALYNPYVNNYVVALNGNEVEVKAPNGVNADHAFRLEENAFVGQWYWNDTAYFIKNGDGDFAGGVNDYGWVGLRLNKNGNSYNCFIELRTTYHEAGITLYSMGYNDVAGNQIRGDDCITGIQGKDIFSGEVYVAGNYLHVTTSEYAAGENLLQIVGLSGQVVHSEQLKSAENLVALDNLPMGTYFVAIEQKNRVIFRKKVFVP